MSENKHLSSREIVRLRPLQFIGDNSTPDHLVNEILDNAFDEVLKYNASKVTFWYDSTNNTIWISDNGRGIKVEKIKLADTNTYEDSIIVLCTHLYSGGKFDDDNRTTIGMNGVGLVVTNMLSNWLVVRTRDRDKRKVIHEYYFEDGLIKSINQFEDNNIDGYSTLVGFQPNKKYFKSTEIDLFNVLKRLLLIKCCSKKDNLSAEFNGQELPKLTFTELTELLLNVELSTKNRKNIITNEFKYFNEKTGEKINLILSYFVSGFGAKKSQFIPKKLANLQNLTPLIVNQGNNASGSRRFEGAVNNRFCKGTLIDGHITKKIKYEGIKTLLHKIILPKIDKKYHQLPMNDILNNFCGFVNIYVSNPQFSEQAKITLKSDVSHLILPLKNTIEEWMENNNIFEHIQNYLKKAFDKRLGIKRKRNTKISAKSKLCDAIKIPGEILYIVEGDSALGTIKQIRDSKSEGIFPLKGKIINVETNSINKILQNNEVKYLKEAIGNQSNRRYQYIDILADADVDGRHIVVLCLLLLNRFASDMIEEGRIRIILPPLFGAIKGEEFIPIYNSELLQSYSNNNYSIIRFKGLGEMSPEQLEVIIRGNYRYVVQPSKNIETLFRMVGNDPISVEIRRQLINNPKTTFSVEQFLSK